MYSTDWGWAGKRPMQSCYIPSLWAWGSGPDNHSFFGMGKFLELFPPSPPHLMNWKYLPKFTFWWNMDWYWYGQASRRFSMYLLTLPFLCFMSYPTEDSSPKCFLSFLARRLISIDPPDKASLLTHGAWHRPSFTHALPVTFTTTEWYESCLTATHCANCLVACHYSCQHIIRFRTFRRLDRKR